MSICSEISMPFGLVQIGEELSRNTATSRWFFNLTLKMPGHLPPCTHISISHHLSPESITYNVLCPSQSPRKHLSCLLPGPLALISKPIPPLCYHPNAKAKPVIAATALYSILSVYKCLLIIQYASSPCLLLDSPLHSKCRTEYHI